MDELNPGLATDPLFVGATRPPMRWGVTYSALLFNMVFIMEAFLVTKNLLTLLLGAADSWHLRAALRAGRAILRFGAAVRPNALAGGVRESAPVEGEQLFAAGDRSPAPLPTPTARVDRCGVCLSFGPAAAAI